MDMQDSSVQAFCVPQISCSIKGQFVPHLLCALAFVCCYIPVSASVCVCLWICVSLYCLCISACVSLCHSQHPPVRQLEGDSPIRAGPVVQRLSAVVSDTELSLSLHNCQSALVHSDPSGSLPLSHSNSPLDSHWQPYQFPEPSMALLSSLASN